MLQKLGERIGAALVVAFWVTSAWFLTMQGSSGGYEEDHHG